LSSPKVLPEPQYPQGSADLRFLNPQPDTRLHGKATNTGLVHGASCLFMPQLSLVLTAPAYPRRDGQAELTLVVGYIYQDEKDN